MQVTQAPRGDAARVSITAAALDVALHSATLREGSDALLRAIAPLVRVPAAMAVSDRDHRTFHLLAETDSDEPWPTSVRCDAPLASDPVVDVSRETLLLPLRSEGRVHGAVIVQDTKAGLRIARNPEVVSALEVCGAVLASLAERCEAVLRRREHAATSADLVLHGMVHQLINPLTGASTITQLLIDEAQGDDRSALEQIGNELRRAFVVLEDLRDLQNDHRADDGIVDVATLVARIASLRAYAIRENGITLDVDISREFAPCRVPARDLRRAIGIAMTFAEGRSHGTVNRSISVRVVNDSDAVRVEITDSGPGDVPEIHHTYFDMPLDDAVGRIPAPVADLGLLQSILRAHGGDLRLHGSKTEGTQLVLVLPRAILHAASADPIHRESHGRGS